MKVLINLNQKVLVTLNQVEHHLVHLGSTVMLRRSLFGASQLHCTRQGNRRRRCPHPLHGVGKAHHSGFPQPPSVGQGGLTLRAGQPKLANNACTNPVQSATNQSSIVCLTMATPVSPLAPASAEQEEAALDSKAVLFTALLFAKIEGMELPFHKIDNEQIICESNCSPN